MRDGRVSPCFSWHGVGIGAVAQSIQNSIEDSLDCFNDIAGSRSIPRRTKTSHCQGI